MNEGEHLWAYALSNLPALWRSCTNIVSYHHIHMVFMPNYHKGLTRGIFLQKKSPSTSHSLSLKKICKGLKAPHLTFIGSTHFYSKRLTTTRAKRLFGKLSLRSTFLMSFEPYTWVSGSGYALNWMDEKVNAEQKYFCGMNKYLISSLLYRGVGLDKSFLSPPTPPSLLWIESDGVGKHQKFEMYEENQ